MIPARLRARSLRPERHLRVTHQPCVDGPPICLADTGGPISASVTVLHPVYQPARSTTMSVEAKDLKHATELLAKHPGVRAGGFEIRPANEEINALIAARSRAGSR